MVDIISALIISIAIACLSLSIAINPIPTKASAPKPYLPEGLGGGSKGDIRLAPTQ